MTNLELMHLAITAREGSYSPYSNFKVGAALLAKNGKVYLGCNIENSAYTPTVCAERVAFFKAVSEGVREFDCIAIVGGKSDEKPRFCAPCGVCRQVMTEFCGSDFKIILGDAESVNEYSLYDILPFAFTPNDLK